MNDEQKAIVRRLYIEEKLSPRKIAKLHNIPYTTIYHYLNKIGRIRKKFIPKPKEEKRFDYAAYMEDLIIHCCEVTHMSEKEFKEYIKTPEGEYNLTRASEIFTPIKFSPPCFAKLRRSKGIKNEFGSLVSAKTAQLNNLLFRKEGASMEELKAVRGAIPQHICWLKKKGYKIYFLKGRFYGKI